jgi:hypothetical protein
VSLITRSCKQTAVYWQRDDADRFGQPTYLDPIEVACRWDDSHETFLDTQGDKQVSNAMVIVAFTAAQETAGAELKPQGVLMLGELTDVQDGVDPLQHPGAYEIRKTESNPNRRVSEYLRTAIL